MPPEDSANPNLPQATSEDLAQQRTELAEHRTTWAEGRTDWAKQRTLLANERTFAAWQRNGLVITALGVAAAQLLPEVGPALLIDIAGLALVLLGGLIFLLGFRTHYRAVKRLGGATSEGMPIWLLLLLTLILLGANLISIFIILL